MKLTLTLELDNEDDALVHPRIAGALRDYAAAVIDNNRKIMRATRNSGALDEPMAGEPPVGLTHDGQLRTAQGVTITEAVEL